MSPIAAPQTAGASSVFLPHVADMSCNACTGIVAAKKPARQVTAHNIVALRSEHTPPNAITEAGYFFGKATKYGVANPIPSLRRSPTPGI
jgi:hypothetical protein